MESRNKQIKVGVGAIILDGNKTLLSKRKGSHGAGSFGSIGGHVEYGESPIAAIKREAREELGVDLEEVEFLVCTNLLKYGKHYIDITFTAKIKSGDPTIQEPEKIESVGWYSLNELPFPLFKPVEIGLEALKSK